MYYVYLLKSKNHRWYYIGCTADLRSRVHKHNSGLVKSTKYYKPFILIYYEAYPTLEMARKREYSLKHNNQQKELLFKRLEI